MSIRQSKTPSKTYTVTIVGAGFVGVVTAAVLANFGNRVFGLDVDEQKIRNLQKGIAPFFEPGLDDLLKNTLKNKNLSFTTDYAQAIPTADVAIVAVGTPSTAEGGVDLRYVLAAAKSMAPHLKEGAIVAIKSTVPPQAIPEVRKVLDEHASVKTVIATIPEFLREGSAVADTTHPSRVVIGADDTQAFTVLKQLHEPFGAPIVRTNPASAQMAKYAANAFLATRITFINQIADLCEKNHADVDEVIRAIGFDSRIGDHYWYPGLGYGGSCFPKDVRELAHFSRQVGEARNLFNKLRELNEHRLSRLYEQFKSFVGGWKGKTVAMLGLAFKPNTDDTRESPSMKLAEWLVRDGAKVRAYDPKASISAFISPATKKGFTEIESIDSACRTADVLLLLTEWAEIVSFDYDSVRDSSRPQWIIDTRNQLDETALVRQGYRYRGIGKGA